MNAKITNFVKTTKVYLGKQKYIQSSYEVAETFLEISLEDEKENSMLNKFV